MAITGRSVERVKDPHFLRDGGARDVGNISFIVNTAPYFPLQRQIKVVATT